MGGVQVSLSDFPDDIVEPMTPILEAIGLVDLGDDNLDINGWDSLAHTILMLELENEFAVKFTAAETMNFSNVSEIVDSVFSHKG